MTTRGDREEDVWLSDAQLAKLARFGEDRIVFGSDSGAKGKILGLNLARLYKIRAQGGVAGDASDGLYKPLPRDYENRISVPLKTLLEYPGLAQDKLALARREYLAAGARPSHTRYGWVHTG